MVDDIRLLSKKWPKLTIEQKIDGLLSLFRSAPENKAPRSVSWALVQEFIDAQIRAGNPSGDSQTDIRLGELFALGDYERMYAEFFKATAQDNKNSGGDRRFRDRLLSLFHTEGYQRLPLEDLAAQIPKVISKREAYRLLRGFDPAQQALDRLSNKHPEKKETFLIADNSKAHVLIMERSKPQALAISASVEKAGCIAIPLKTQAEALKIVKIKPFQVAIVSISPSTAGHLLSKFIEKLRASAPDIRIIFTASPKTATVVLERFRQATALGSDDCLFKPIDASRLISSISQSLQWHELSRGQ